MAEYTLLKKLDPGDLHQFDQAHALSNELLVKWLSTYKFKNWRMTEMRGSKVTPKLLEDYMRRGNALSFIHSREYF